MDHNADLLNKTAQAGRASVVHATWGSALGAGVVLLAVGRARLLALPGREGVVVVAVAGSSLRLVEVTKTSPLSFALDPASL